MITSRVSRKGLTSIPASVKRALGIEEGDILVWEVDENRHIATIKVVKNPAKYLKGKYRDPKLTYEKIEEEADKVIMGEIHASD